MQTSAIDSNESFEKALNQALKFLSFRPRSEKEVNQFLSRKKTDEKTISKVINQLKEQKLLDDSEFAKWWIEQRQTFNVKSKFIIKHELLQKGVAREIIDDLLIKSTDDYLVASLTFEKNKHKFKNYTGREYFQKASSFLQRKGFGWETIKKILKRQEND